MEDYEAISKALQTLIWVLIKCKHQKYKPHFFFTKNSWIFGVGFLCQLGCKNHPKSIPTWAYINYSEQERWKLHACLKLVVFLRSFSRHEE